jgi:hypothetical protein
MAKGSMHTWVRIVAIAAALHLGARYGQAKDTEQSGYNLYVGNLHSHTSYSDGVGTPATAFAYARDIAGIDFLAVTDHYGTTPGQFADLMLQADAYTEDGIFVAIAGQEWSGLYSNHCNVFEADHDFKAPRNDIDSLYREIVASGCTANFNHPAPGFFDNYAYSAIGDVGINAVEVRNEQEQQMYVQILNSGWHVGADGSEDNHRADWGDWRSWTVALAESLTKADILDAMRNRRTYSTLDRDLRMTFRANGHWMGEAFSDGGNIDFSIDVEDPDIGESSEYIELYENGMIIASRKMGGSVLSWHPEITPPDGDNYYFVKVCVQDYYHHSWGRAWSSPVWIHCTTPLPSTPVLCSPDEGTTVTTTLAPIFEWLRSQNANEYTLEYSTSRDFPCGPSTVTAQGIVDTCYVPTRDLGDRVAYYWRVKAANDSGSSTYCEARSLFLDVGLFPWYSETRMTSDPSADVCPSIFQTSADLWLVWSSDRNGSGELYRRTSADCGETWSGETRLTVNAWDDEDPAITEDLDGRIWVAWQSARDGDYEIYYKTYQDGSWSADTRLTDHPYADVAPVMARTSDGGVWIVWSSDRRDGNYEIYGMEFSEGSWSSLNRLTSNASQDYCPGAVGTDDGKLWVVWCSDRDGASDVYGRVFDGTSWSEDTRLTYSAEEENYPAITQTSEGEIWVTYTKSGKLFYKRYDGVDWSDESMFYDRSSSNTWTAIAQTCDGRMCEACCSTRDGNQDIYTQISASPASAAVPTEDDVSATSGSAFSRIAPNPFVGQTSIGFALSNAGYIDLAIYSIRGQKVRTLARGPASAGRHEAVWDGTDASGHPVSPGIYLCRLQAGDKSSSRKLVVVK